MLTLIIIVLILMAICRPRRYRGFGPYHHHGPFFGPPMGGPRGPHGPMCGGPFDHGPGGPFGPGHGGHRGPGGPFGPGSRW